MIVMAASNDMVRKGQRRLDGVDSMVISLTAKGLTGLPLESWRVADSGSVRLIGRTIGST